MPYVGSEQMLIPIVTVCYSFHITINVSRKSWDAIGKVMVRVNRAVPCTSYLTIVGQGSMKGFLVGVVLATESKTSSRNAEEGKKRKK